MMATPAVSGVSFRIATPQNWFDLDLDPRTSRRSITRMVERYVGTDPDHAGLRAHMTAYLRDATAQAIENGAIRAFVLSDMIRDTPLAASLVITLARMQESVDLDRLVRDVAPTPETTRDAAEAGITDLPAGRAVRVRARRVVEVPQANGRRVATITVQYFVALPSDRGVLVLSFSSPNVSVEDALVELFDTVAASLQWEG